MRELSSNSHRIPTMRRIMGCMGTAWKVVVGLVLLLPMTAYVAVSLVAAANEPLEHQPIIVQEQTQKPNKPGPSPSQKPTEQPDDHKKGREGDGDSSGPEVIVPPPSDLFDDHGGDDDNSGKGSGDDDGDSSGKGSGDD
jgi:hypothetical protein